MEPPSGIRDLTGMGAVDARAIVPVKDAHGGVTIYHRGCPTHYLLAGERYEAVPASHGPIQPHTDRSQHQNNHHGTGRGRHNNLRTWKRIRPLKMCRAAGAANRFLADSIKVLLRTWVITLRPKESPPPLPRSVS